MAKLSAHGQEVGRIEYTAKTVAYMSDGKVLVNHGTGWKLRGTLKAGITPEIGFSNAKQKAADFLAQRPAAAAYRKALHDLAGLCKRAKLHLAVTLMPDDCDGVWSEACDGYGDNISASCDEVAELCAAYRAAIVEQKSFTAQREIA